MTPGALILETGEIFKGLLSSDIIQAGEVVFNTSHLGYEEIATDPSYYNQILVMTAPLQGNYGSDLKYWQSEKIWIKAFVCLEMQNSLRDEQWLKTLTAHKIPILSSVDTRNLVLRLRRKGVIWGLVAPLSKKISVKQLIKQEQGKAKDWTKMVSVQKPKEFKGKKRTGLKIALIDFGYKKNILEELLQRSSMVCVFPSNSSPSTIKNWKPSALVLSNGPGDPKDVVEGTQLVKKLLGFKPIFGICMGHQVLSQALGGRTYKLKFGHRGSNHPIQDKLLNRVYISAQNHGYVVNPKTLPKEVSISHINLNDHTTAGIFSKKYKCLSVQFHPEHSPGPKEGTALFDYFIKNLLKKGK
ncbi:MAG: glutamine-hydrolyzing carbamoyl-phosphate synthase small subunit [Bdellovibrionaceae bacterium]|nr:glutamine-hydrolyzing carbamoyl-phosphate synthase small subunit [Pseudobdellovibrionaceae bacterium]